MKKRTPHGKKAPSKQLSDMQLREKLRPHVPRAVERLVELMEAKNPNTALGAVRTVIDKFIPTLKATEISAKDDKPFPFTFIVQSSDAKEQLEKLYEGSNSSNN